MTKRKSSRRVERQTLHDLKRELATPAPVSIPDLAPEPRRARPTLALPATVEVPALPAMGATFEVAGVEFAFHGVRVQRVGTVRRRKLALWRVAEPYRPGRTTPPTVVHLPFEGGHVRVATILAALDDGAAGVA